MTVPTWMAKYKRYSIKGRKYWYKTTDGGMSWQKVSAKEVMAYIDSQNGIIINA